ncbi:hypothetical protein QR98_0054440 [Sarcoptes scabiei]|uniref:Uncharacterized protein n=1 Tax=Sarcoptes scabiei TaxID=52283 RepID=A0A132A7M7_SARSC|nr:hypothetical protein QR98_0054440 [Sarcoptes scabiei]
MSSYSYSNAEKLTISGLKPESKLYENLKEEKRIESKLETYLTSVSGRKSLSIRIRKLGRL